MHSIFVTHESHDRLIENRFNPQCLSPAALNYNTQTSNYYIAHSSNTVNSYTAQPTKIKLRNLSYLNELFIKPSATGIQYTCHRPFRPFV